MAAGTVPVFIRNSTEKTEPTVTTLPWPFPALLGNARLLFFRDVLENDGCKQHLVVLESESRREKAENSNRQR